jgi:ABC-type nitrate/sulfonate/bicarbonate transport system substrate-binding protein
MIGCRPLCTSMFALAALLVLASQSPACAQEKLRVGKAVAESYAFIPLDVGVRHGIFKKHGVDIEITAFGGGARLQQAMAAGALDLGVSAGPSSRSWRRARRSRASRCRSVRRFIS